MFYYGVTGLFVLFSSFITCYINNYMVLFRFQIGSVINESDIRRTLEKRKKKPTSMRPRKQVGFVAHSFFQMMINLKF